LRDKLKGVIEQRCIIATAETMKLTGSKYGASPDLSQDIAVVKLNMLCTSDDRRTTWAISSQDYSPRWYVFGTSRDIGEAVVMVGRPMHAIVLLEPELRCRTNTALNPFGKSWGIPQDFVSPAFWSSKMWNHLNFAHV
jgi:hypothetical protein